MTPISAADIPERFWQARYDAGRYPGAEGVAELGDGGNCQLFAYELLRHFGRDLPPFRSSELWADTLYTEAVGADFAALDLLLFNKTSAPYGAHVAAYLGDGGAIHLSQRVGHPAIWPIARFLAEDDYRTLIGAKRVLQRKTQ